MDASQEQGVKEEEGWGVPLMVVDEEEAVRLHEKYTGKEKKKKKKKNYKRIVGKQNRKSPLFPKVMVSFWLIDRYTHRTGRDCRANVSLLLPWKLWMQMVSPERERRHRKGCCI